jgi:rhamnosyltransferase
MPLLPCSPDLPKVARARPTLERAAASVAAIVVLYKPNTALLKRLVESVAPQVEELFVVDNSPQRHSQMPVELVNCGRPVFYRANGMNKGLASAQNTALKEALCEGYTHALLLDQDSALPALAVEGLLAAEQRLLRGGTRVAAVGPLFTDDKTGERSCGVRHRYFRVRWFSIPDNQRDPVETDYLIASGSLIRTSVLRQVGLMRDELFIDWVDTEWAYRARSLGYKTYIVPSVVMMHSVGDATGEFLGKRFNLHSPARNYYIVRNAVFLLRERRMSLSWRCTMLIYVPKYILVHSWLSRHRWRSLLEMLRAILEGMTGRMRPFAGQ